MTKLQHHTMQFATALIMACLWSTTSSAASLTSSVDRKQISTNETLTLTVTYDEAVDSSLLNLKGLEQSFDVLGVRPQSNNSVSIVNGQATRQANTTWTITLVAKNEGSQTIPPLSIKGSRSQAITIQVDKSTQINSTDQPLQVWVSANNNSIYPSQQVIVEVELSAQRNISDLNGPELIVNGADVVSLGQQSFQRMDNGVARQIVILKYAVFAKTAGELVIPVMTYTGVKNGRRSLFGTSGQQVVVRSEQLLIDVKSVPDNNFSAWFPAEKVTINAKWSGEINTLKVGEPVTRTITIVAQGQRSAVIPPLERPVQSSDFKSYKDQPQLENQTTENGFLSTRIESEAIVASAEGTLTLPELRLPWWNVTTGQWQEAILPAETLTVYPATNTSTTPQPDEVKFDTSQIALGHQAEPHSNGAFWKLTSLALGLICLIQFTAIFKLTRQPTPPSTGNQVHTSESAAWAQLQKLLKKSDALAIRQSLLAWARAALPGDKPASLQDLANYSKNEEFQIALNNLNEHLYKGGKKFDSRTLSKLLNQQRHTIFTHSDTAEKPRNHLRPLYSNST